MFRKISRNDPFLIAGFPQVLEVLRLFALLVTDVL